MSKETAVEYMFRLLDVLTFGKDNETQNIFNNILKQAKAMEKEQISIAYQSDRTPCSDEDAEQYYNETYGGDTKQ